MRSLSAVGLRSLRERRGRYLLTGVAIVLGVGVLFSVLVSAASVNRGFDRFTSDFVGRADVVVSPNGSADLGMAPDVVERAGAVDGVANAVGVVGFGASVDVGEDDPEWMMAQGITIESARSIRRFELAEGRFFAPDADEVVLPSGQAERLEVALGGTVALTTPSGRHDLVVVGLLEEEGAARFQGGRVAYLPLGVAQRLSGTGDRLSRVDVDLAPGLDPGAWVDDHRDALGAAVVVNDGDSMGQGFRSFLNTIQSAFGATAALALFVGAFLIYLTFSVAVVERRRLFGMLRAVGATPGQVRRVVLAEAAALAVIASIVGVLVGVGLAALLVRFFAGAADIAVPSLAVTPGAVIAAIAVGVVATLVSALAPARRAARMAPVEAMRDDGGAAGRASRAWIAGLVLVAAAALLASSAGDGAGAGAVMILAVLFLLLGVVLVVPPVLGPVARVLGRVTARLGGGMGSIAVMHLVKERSRSAYTLGLVMVVFATVFGIGAANTSMARALDEVIVRNLGADVTVWASNVFDPEIEARLLGVPGVEAVTPMRFGELRYRDRHGEEQGFPLFVADPASYFEVQGIAWIDGDDATGAAALARGGSIVIPMLLADQLDVGVGDRIEVRATEGWREFAVAGTYTSIGNVPVYASTVDAALLGAGRPNGYGAALADGVSLEEGARRVEAIFDQVADVTVDTFAETKAETRAILAGYFNIAYGILSIVAAVGVLGLANTLIVSVLQRRREIGVLRSVGALRQQVRGLVTVEAATLVLVAFVLAVPLAVVVSRLLIRSFASSFGFSLDYVFPFPMLGVILVIAVVVAVTATLAPARRAARMQPVDALAFE